MINVNQTYRRNSFVIYLCVCVCVYIFSSVTQSCLTLCNPMDCSSPGFPVHPQLPELAQTHVHQVSDAIRPSYHPSSPSPPTCNLSQHQGLFQWFSSSHQLAKVLEFQLQHQSFQWIFRTDMCVCVCVRVCVCIPRANIVLYANYWTKKWQPIPVFLLENSMDRGAQQATVHGVASSQTWLSNWAYQLYLN